MPGGEPRDDRFRNILVIKEDASGEKIGEFRLFVDLNAGVDAFIRKLRVRMGQDNDKQFKHFDIEFCGMYVPHGQNADEDYEDGFNWYFKTQRGERVTVKSATVHIQVRFFDKACGFRDLKLFHEFNGFFVPRNVGLEQLRPEVELAFVNAHIGVSSQFEALQLMDTNKRLIVSDDELQALIYASNKKLVLFAAVQWESGRTMWNCLPLQRRASIEACSAYDHELDESAETLHAIDIKNTDFSLPPGSLVPDDPVLDSLLAKQKKALQKEQAQEDTDTRPDSGSA